MTNIVIEKGDILKTECDVLILKYAQKFYGADLEVAKALDLYEHQGEILTPGKYQSIATEGRLQCKRVLFIGVQELWNFGYAEIRRFSKKALEIISEEPYEKNSLAMTIHGIGYGFDEREAFSAQVGGLIEYLNSSGNIWKPDTIKIVERNPKRMEILSSFWDSIKPSTGFEETSHSDMKLSPQIANAGIESDKKKLVFVAMPYDEEMQDVYEFGIYQTINSAGYLCERCDRTAFTGDVMDRIKKRISASKLVIADVTGANPNVYLEVGYAWGKGVPTLLIAKEGQDLQFDVRTHRCIFYKNISNLKIQLSDIMPRLISGESLGR